jgi:2-oxoisovalerate dehydrogenase E1 component
MPHRRGGQDAQDRQSRLISLWSREHACCSYERARHRLVGGATLPKNLIIDPSVTRAASELRSAPIPVHAYSQPLAEARLSLGDDLLRRMLRDMVVIREFEGMLDGFKRRGEYETLRYTHLGPAHLSIGQEAAAVGQAAALEIEDHIFGSHRSHGEVIAKGLAAIDRLDDASLLDQLQAGGDAEALRLLERHLDAPDPKTRATQFLLYGLSAEIFGRRTGFNLGLAGSMHAFFPPFGIYPNNAIVGGSAPIAVGSALYKRLFGTPRGIAVANIGDGSSGCGVVCESINFAGMRQLRRFWDVSYRGGLPVLFFFVNNFYAMGGQTQGETMSYDHLARIAAGFSDENLHAEVVDGNDPLAVADAVRRKRALLDSGEGPALLDVQCYRQVGHSTSDASSYRTREELELWRAIDPVERFAADLSNVGITSSQHLEDVREMARGLIRGIAELAIDDDLSPRLSLSRRGRELEHLTFANETEELDLSAAAELSAPLHTSKRLAALAAKGRSGLRADGTQLPGARAITIRDALFEAIVERFAHDPKLIAYGEENRDWEGAFGVYRGLTELLPYHRLFNAPISEAAIVGTAVGYAAEGGRALIELMYADFIGRAGDELFNQLAKWHAMSGGVLRMRVVCRVSVGSTYGAQHSQEWTGLISHIPGLKVVYPTTPYDAKGLMAAALAGTDPVIFFESQKLYDAVELFRADGVPTHHYRLPIGEPDRKRQGKDVTILTVGATLYRADAAARRLDEEFGISVDLFDARSLVPFNVEPVVASVRNTHHLLLASDAVEQGSYLHTLATLIGERAFDDLDAPIVVLGACNAIAPPAELEDTYLVQPDDIIDAVNERLIPLTRR